MKSDSDEQPVPTEIPPATGGLAAAFGLWRDMPDDPFAVYEQPAVIYVAANGMWLPRPYPHVATVPYYPRAEHDALHQRCAEAEALAFNATNALADVTAERDALRWHLEQAGIEVIGAPIRLAGERDGR